MKDGLQKHTSKVTNERNARPTCSFLIYINYSHQLLISNFETI